MGPRSLINISVIVHMMARCVICINYDKIDNTIFCEFNRCNRNKEMMDDTTHLLTRVGKNILLSPK